MQAVRDSFIDNVWSWEKPAFCGRRLEASGPSRPGRRVDARCFAGLGKGRLRRRRCETNGPDGKRLELAPGPKALQIGWHDRADRRRRNSQIAKRQRAFAHELVRTARTRNTDKPALTTRFAQDERGQLPFAEDFGTRKLIGSPADQSRIVDRALDGRCDISGVDGLQPPCAAAGEEQRGQKPGPGREVIEEAIVGPEGARASQDRCGRKPVADGELAARAQAFARGSRFRETRRAARCERDS